ncbi:LacI family DNA-binding transcriptional regulator [Planctomicrobium sp. SH661]|uniref:LacI family DNA-binding transcriptional regulator n=1 Tax=Planctomicrobium sp. SH661 TaxID=3448124 RepID=UPI003F5C0FCB
MKVTMRELADAANVSISTVSRVLKGDPAISVQRAEQIRALAVKMNYFRHQPAPGSGHLEQALQGKVVGIVSLGMDRSLLSVPAVAQAINGAEAALSEAGANVLLRHVPKLNASTPALLSQPLDGVILLGALQGNEIGREHNQLIDRLRDLPSVWLLGKPLGCWGDSVCSHSYHVGARAAAYLVRQGHRHLAFLNPKPDHQQFMIREDGFVAQARRLGVSVVSLCRAPEEGWHLPLQPPINEAAVGQLIDELFSLDPRPTAIFTAADSVAAVFYRAMATRGLQVGEEISVISANNDESWIAGLHPSLTTFDIHAEQIGHLAVQQLVRRMLQPTETPDVEIQLEATFVERESVVKR